MMTYIVTATRYVFELIKLQNSLLISFGLPTAVLKSGYSIFNCLMQFSMNLLKKRMSSLLLPSQKGFPISKQLIDISLFTGAQVCCHHPMTTITLFLKKKRNKRLKILKKFKKFLK